MAKVPPFPAHAPALKIVLSGPFSVIVTPQEGAMAEGDSDRQNSLWAGHVRTVPQGTKGQEGLGQCWGEGRERRRG